MNKNRDQNDEIVIDLGEVLMTLWDHAVVILLSGILFAGLAFFYARSFVTPVYEANALLYVNNSSFSLSSAVKITTGELSAASDLVDTYVAIMQSRANMELVIEKSGVDYTYEELRKMVSAKAVNSTGLFQLTVRSSIPEEARSLANTIATILPEKISDIVANSSVEVVDYAVTPHTRSSPDYMKYALAGLLFGIFLSGGIVLLIDFLDDTIRDEDFLLQNFDAPLLASIPDLTAKTEKKYGYYGSSAYGRGKKGGVD